MSRMNYLVFTLVGMVIVLMVANFGIMDYSKVLAGVLMGIGLSVSAFSFFKLLVNYEGKTAEK